MWKDDVFIALGSNLGDSIETFNRVFAEMDHFCKNTVRSNIYRTKPYGFIDQNDFYNAALRVSTDLNPQDLIKKLQGIEKRLGKTVLFENGPRAIDLDIVFYANELITENTLKIPHPSAHLRDFVLLPIADIDASFTHPTLNKSISDLIMDLDSHHFTGEVIDWV